MQFFRNFQLPGAKIVTKIYLHYPENYFYIDNYANLYIQCVAAAGEGGEQTCVETSMAFNASAASTSCQRVLIAASENIVKSAPSEDLALESDNVRSWIYYIIRITNPVQIITWNINFGKSQICLICLIFIIIFKWELFCF